MNKKRILGVVAGAIVMAMGAALFASTRDSGPPMRVRELDKASRTFDARKLLAVADADMAATAYVDGVLDHIDGSQDTLSQLMPAEPNASIESVPASNSVAGWPGTLDVAPDGTVAYVIETFGRAPAGVEKIENTHTGFLPGRLLTTIDISGDAPRVLRLDDVGSHPGSIHCAPDGRWLAIATTDKKTPLTLVMLDRGVPVELRRPTIDLPVIASPEGSSLSFARVSPDGKRIALHIVNTSVAFGDLVFDEEGRPTNVRLGAAIHAGKYISIGRWSNDGRYYIVADTDWGPSPADAMRAGVGRLTAIDAQALRVTSSANVSFGPEGFDMNRDGDLIVVVNMERTYAPERMPYSLIPRRKQASLSLVAFDKSNGHLTTIDGPLAFDGALPEDAVFDRDGDLIAVAIYQDRKTSPKEGWVEFFSVDRSAATARLARTGRRIRLPRGVHDLAVVY